MILLARRSLAVLASASAMMLLTTGVLPLGAQESSTAKSQAAKTKKSDAGSSSSSKQTAKTAPPDVTHRVPPGYSKLGLSESQKEKLYKIQGEYYPKIQALRSRLTICGCAVRRSSRPF